MNKGIYSNEWEKGKSSVNHHEDRHKIQTISLQEKNKPFSTNKDSNDKEYESSEEVEDEFFHELNKNRTSKSIENESVDKVLSDEEQADTSMIKDHNHVNKNKNMIEWWKVSNHSSIVII